LELDKRWRPTVAVSALIWRGNEALFLHRVQPPIAWVPPGGRVEMGESPLEALKREIREETTLEHVSHATPCIAEAGKHAGEEILYLDFTCRFTGGDIVLDPREHDGWRWLSLDHLTHAEAECGIAVGGEPFCRYRWAGRELICSHSLPQLLLARRILGCVQELTCSSPPRR